MQKIWYPKIRWYDFISFIVFMISSCVSKFQIYIFDFIFQRMMSFPSFSISLLFHFCFLFFQFSRISSFHFSLLHFLSVFPMTIFHFHFHREKEKERNSFFAYCTGLVSSNYLKKMHIDYFTIYFCSMGLERKAYKQKIRYNKQKHGLNHFGQKMLSSVFLLIVPSLWVQTFQNMHIDPILLYMSAPLLWKEKHINKNSVQ